MANGLLTEQPAVSKRKNSEPKPSPNDPSPPFVRIELQAPPDWTAELDRAAAALGVSRSAYIRMACNRMMTADRRERGSG